MSDTVAASYTFVGDHVSARRRRRRRRRGRRRRSGLGIVAPDQVMGIGIVDRGSREHGSTMPHRAGPVY